MRDYGTIKLEGGKWLIHCTPDAAMRIKRIFPRMMQSGGRDLSIKSTPEIAFDLRWMLERFRMTIPRGDAKAMKAQSDLHEEKLRRAELAFSGPPLPGSFSMVRPPREYQAQAAALYAAQGHLLLADCVGLGKTVTAIATFNATTLPAVVVVKAHLPKQWREEIATFMPSLRVHIVKQNAPYDLPSADVYIISYSKLSSWWGPLAERCNSIVFDEVQELRIMGSAKYEAAASLTSVVSKRLGLSATPIHNYGGEIWAVFNLLCPDTLGSHSEFIREWCVHNGSHFMVKDPEALGAYLFGEKLMLRRTRKDVGRVLPPVIRYVQEAQFDEDVYKKGTSSAEELARIILNGTFVERGQAARQFDLKLRQATGLAKAPYVAELVRMLIESGEKVLLGGWHRVVYDVWRERLSDLNPVFFTGSETAGQKESARRDFIDDKTDLLIMSLRSGAGTNGLQDVCSVVVLGELDWTPAVHEQFIGRLNRDGQDESVQVFIPVAPVGSDPTMAAVLGLKQAQATGIVDQGHDVDADLIEVEPHRIKQLAEDFLRSKGVTCEEVPA